MTRTGSAFFPRGKKNPKQTKRGFSVTAVVPASEAVIFIRASVQHLQGLKEKRN